MRVAIATLGCKVNQYDTAVIEKRFDDLGWARVEFGAEADAYVVNSCTVTDRADAEAEPDVVLQRVDGRHLHRHVELEAEPIGRLAHDRPGTELALGDDERIPAERPLV